MFEERKYREAMGEGRFRSFRAAIDESDLWIGVDPGSWNPAMEGAALREIARLRAEISAYAARRPAFRDSLVPIADDAAAPECARAMIASSAVPRVGPFAAVAGAVAERVGRALWGEFGCAEIVVENGGDLWASFAGELSVPVHAGTSPLSGKVGFRVPASLSPLSICCSAGNVGPSLSFGRADAACAIAADAALADAWATALGNMARVPEDIEGALDSAFARDGRLLGAMIVMGDRMGLRGELPLGVFA